MLTDADFKSTQAYALIKEVQREVQQQASVGSDDLESTPNLNHCKEAVGQILNTFMVDGGQKKGGGEKINKAQDIVDQAKKLMGENVKKMIDN